MPECMYCQNQRSEEDMRSYPPYSYDKYVCDYCWNNCPDCDNDNWEFKSYKSPRKHNKKVCSNCGFSFTTKVASG